MKKISKEQKSFLIEGGVVYLLWLLGQALANSLMVEKSTFRMGNLVYMTVVTITSVILPFYLSYKRNLRITFSLGKVGVKGVLTGVVSVLLMFMNR